jgi:hypothetical protein
MTPAETKNPKAGALGLVCRQIPCRAAYVAWFASIIPMAGVGFMAANGIGPIAQVKQAKRQAKRAAEAIGRP